MTQQLHPALCNCGITATVPRESLLARFVRWWCALTPCREFGVNGARAFGFCEDCIEELNAKRQAAEKARFEVLVAECLERRVVV